MTQPPTPNPNFDPVARPYRWMEYLTFGRSLERTRNHFLPQLTTRRRALILGDGDGRFLARLLTQNPQLETDAVDQSPAMLSLLEARAHASAANTQARLHTHIADARLFTPNQPCDLIVTHFFLDCLTQSQVDELARRLRHHIVPGTLWLLSDFRIPRGPLHWPARAMVRSLYLVFRILTGLRTSSLPDHAAALSAASFRRVQRHLSLGGLLTSELWEYTPAMLPPQKPKPHTPLDPVPDPEPASPSLPEPDPGVFHPEPDKPSGAPPPTSSSVN